VCAEAAWTASAEPGPRVTVTLERLAAALEKT
jgi:hypothetical protein